MMRQAKDWPEEPSRIWIDWHTTPPTVYLNPQRPYGEHLTPYKIDDQVKD